MECPVMPGGGDSEDTSQSLGPSQDVSSTSDNSATDTDEEVSQRITTVGAKHVAVGVQHVVPHTFTYNASHTQLSPSLVKSPTDTAFDTSPKIAKKTPTILNQITIDASDSENNPSNNNDSEKKKNTPILGFNAYGNLTMLDETTPEPAMDPFDSIVPEDFMQDGLPVVEPLPKKKSKVKVISDSQHENSHQKIHNNGTIKKRAKSQETSHIEEAYSENELKQVFKSEFNTGATSRYGRARKRKTEDGFLFGTINFNELRRISGGSPKKNKLHEETSEASEVKTDEEEPMSVPTDVEQIKTEPESSVDELTEASDFTEEKIIPKEPVVTPPKSPRKKKYQKKSSPKKKQVENDDEDESWTARQCNTRTKAPSKSPRKSIGRSSKTRSTDRSKDNKCTRKLRRLSTPKYNDDESNKETDAEELNQDIVKISQEIKTEDLKQDSDYLTGDEEYKPETNNKSQRTSRSSQKHKPQDKKQDPETPVSPTTTKSGRQSKKFVPLDNSLELVKSKEGRKRRKDDDQNIKKEEVVQPKPTSVKLEKEIPLDFLAGDLVWVLMRGQPMWPAVLTYHLEEEQYTKVMCKNKSYVRLYHVQFCNDNQLANWVSVSHVSSFNGYQNLIEYLNSMKSQANADKKVSKNIIILNTLSFLTKSGAKYNKWIASIEEAEELYQLPRNKRLAKLYEIEEGREGFEKTVKKGKIQSEKKRKRSKREKELSSKSSVASEESSLIKEDKMEILNEVKAEHEEFSGFDESSNESQKHKRQKLMEHVSQSSFSIYLNQHRDALLQEDPTLSENAIYSKLTSRWKKMTNVQKARYKTPKRKHSPSPDVETSSVDSVATSTSSGKRRRGKGSDDDERGTYKIVRNDRVCYNCENVISRATQELVKCRGTCCGVFHYSCLGLASVPSKEFKCDECLSNKHPCFICKSYESEIVKCSVMFCGKYYHEKCVKKWPQVSKHRQEKLICPRHVCHMCAANVDDMSDPAARTAPFTRCLRCPTTYHTGEECIAAGSEEISQTHHICTKHLKVSKSYNLHLNVSWCFCCSKGGSLLLCDQCPAAFHAECIKITTPEGGYVCEECENGKVPVYGDVVWVKLGSYRWWPAQVLHPRHIPDNIENLNHQQGMFCVHFLGSNDYYWVTRGRTFHYQEGDQGTKASYSTKTLEKRFAQALEEAAVLYQTQRTRRDKSEAERSEKSNSKPAPFVKIETNRPVGNVKLGKLDLASVNKCECDPYSESPCSDDEKCLNRMLMFECIREVCPAGDRCCNQRFQRRQYPNVAYAKTERRGWGLKTLEDVKKGQFVIEYVGELVDEEEFRRRLSEMHDVKEENYYFLTIDKTLMIDAGPKGNLARFMNHSCQPNCETQKWTVGADTRVGLFAIDDIPAGSELTFNYNLECVGTEKKKCQCGAENCSGFIGTKVKPEKRVPMKNEKLKNGKKKKKPRPQKSTEDECFRCGSAGDLILCDISTCPKGYHLGCLGLDKLPKGKWYCPWHHCDVCGLKATSLCDYCPNSYCRSHTTGSLQIINNVGNVCLEHTDDIEAGSDGNDSSESEDSRRDGDRRDSIPC